MLFRSSLVTIGCLAFASVAHAQSGPPAAPGAAAAPIEVGVVTMHGQSVPFTVALTGRVTASQEAEVRPQVGGVIKAINFREGSQVKAGDVLYEIDDASYKANVAVAQAAVEKAEAAVTSAQAKYDRYVKLGSNVSASDLEDARIALVQAQADVASAKASLDAAQINLGLTKVAAPISGLISRSAVTQGALVTAAQTTALATVRLLDPIFVDLVDTSVNLLRIRSEVESGTLQGGGRGQPPTVRLTLEDGSSYGEAGRMTLTDVVVSESTGTFSLRATFPNPHRLLLPGMFVRAQVDLGSNPKAFLVPQRAVTFNASGEATVLVAVAGKAVSRVLVTDGTMANAWIVTTGISDGDQVIVDGLQKVSAGSSVKPVEVALDDNGVVHQTIGEAPAPATGQ